MYGNVIVQLILGSDIKATFRSKSWNEKSANLHDMLERRKEKSIFHSLFEFRGLPHAPT